METKSYSKALKISHAHGTETIALLTSAFIYTPCTQRVVEHKFRGNMINNIKT